jgi:4-hydroxybutyrate CoA-transferase
LSNSREGLKDVTLYSMFGLLPESADLIESPDMSEHVTFVPTIIGVNEIKRWPNKGLDHVFVHFSELEDMIKRRVNPDAVLVRGCPMDENGFVHLAASNGGARAAVDCGAKVIVQIDRNAPHIYTDYHRVHISEIDALCEAENPLYEAPKKAVGIKEKRIAAHIAERVPNGASLQLGVGSIPDAVGALLDNHKDLGIHTEVFTDSMALLMEKGIVNNSKKNVLPGVSVAGFLVGNKHTQEFAHNNPDILLKNLSWINDPILISQIHDMVSINSCLAVDLRAQVCSESLGHSISYGIGGQDNFIMGSRRGPGGKSFLAMHAAIEKENGEKISKITLALPAGSVVTTPRTDVMCVVTEYGVADLMFKSVKEQARNLIDIADPEFREQLAFEAKKHGLLL